VNLFVYYKFKPSEFPHLKTELQALQTKIQQNFPNVQVRLLKRPEPDESGQETWMESYEFEPALLPRIRSTLDGLITELKLPDRRAFEVFVDI
jgi:hypothetical protein